MMKPQNGYRVEMESTVRCVTWIEATDEEDAKQAIRENSRDLPYAAVEQAKSEPTLVRLERMSGAEYMGAEKAV